MKTALFAINITLCSQLAFAAQNGSFRDRTKPYLEAALTAGQAFVVVSSASGMPNLAPDSLASAVGENLSSQTETGTAPYPTSLAGVTVQVVDSAGAVRLAPLVYVSPGQINFLVPAGTATGTATVNISNGDGSPIPGTIQLQAVAPALFTANENGQGVAAATAYRMVIPTNVAVPVPVYQCLDKPGTCISVPLSIGVDVPVFVTFNATGLRGRSSDAAVQLMIGGQPAKIQAINSLDDNSASAGIDQLFVPLPISLRGSGEVDVVVSADGTTSNIARLNIQ
jgi:uncharacterized protein (TIGR03437 family)